MLASACDIEGPGAASRAALRPDGKTIYSACERPAWSRDGMRIAFISFALPEGDASEDHWDLRIHVVGANGEGLAVLNGGTDPGDELKQGDRMLPNFPS